MRGLIERGSGRELSLRWAGGGSPRVRRPEAGGGGGNVGLGGFWRDERADRKVVTGRKRLDFCAHGFSFVAIWTGGVS